MVCRLAQTFTVVKDEGTIVTVLVGRTLGMILGMVEGEGARGFGLGVERGRVHGGDEWGRKGRGWFGLYNQVTGRGSRGRTAKAVFVSDETYVQGPKSPFRSVAPEEAKARRGRRSLTRF